MGIADVARFLQESLGQKLVAYLAEVDPKTVGQWAADKRGPRQPAEERLRNTYMVFQLLLKSDDAHAVRAWFMGLNPLLDDESPATAIREGRFKDVLKAARSFVDGA